MVLILLLVSWRLLFVSLRKLLWRRACGLSCVMRCRRRFRVSLCVLSSSVTVVLSCLWWCRRLL